MVEHLGSMGTRRKQRPCHRDGHGCRIDGPPEYREDCQAVRSFPGVATRAQDRAHVLHLPRSDCGRPGVVSDWAGVHPAAVGQAQVGGPRDEEPRDSGRTTTMLDASSPVHVDALRPVAPIGSTIGENYRILDVLGSGGMGIVLRALDEHLDREVAIKLIHAGGLSQAHWRARFRAEARAMARVRHTNVVEIFAFGEHHGMPYFVMQYVPGPNLASWMRQDTAHELAERMVILEQIFHGVAAIHDEGTLHRDLKPSNVLVGPGRAVAVTDLGLAQLVGRADDPVLASFVGTPAYLAPELAREESIIPELAHRIDVYALGCVTFELLTGRLPFSAKGLPAMLTDHGHTLPPRPSEVAPGLSPAFDRPLMEALAKDPRHRTADVSTLRRQMQAAFEQSSPRFDGLDILVVDDDPANLQAMQALLEDVFPSVSIRCAADGRVALQLALARTPSVVVTDLDMPHRGGLELTASLRSCTRTANVPIIVVTGQGGAKDWKVLHALGADRFLVKPIVPDTLINELRAFMSAQMPPP
jgi:eukaryotic-like serine/threonine-protein kinase